MEKTLRSCADQIVEASIRAVLPDEAVRRALDCWKQPDAMHGLISNAMQADFGFEISAQEYARLYICML